MKTSKKDVGKRIVALRDAKEMKQKDLADDTGIGQQRLSIIESGEGYPTIEQLVELSRVLKVSTDYLLTGKDREDPDVTIIKALIKKLSEASKNI